ncbi:MAG: hypothetical protein D6714_07425 [Bacteroidetes bacterium]|nr:MAG: hypothetical protein D6714_07425 [Bacteroidota bacterium]
MNGSVCFGRLPQVLFSPAFAWAGFVRIKKIPEGWHLCRKKNDVLFGVASPAFDLRPRTAFSTSKDN